MTSNNYKFIFWGTSSFSVSVLDKLKSEGVIPSLIVTEPDKPRDRGLFLDSSPVKKWGQENNVPVFDPKKLKTEEVLQKLRDEKADFSLVASYGRILPENILSLFPNKFLNIHPSLLPKYRGPSPIQSAILNDEKKNGVTIIILDKEMDHGPVLGKREVTINDWPPNSSELSKILAETGAELLIEILPKWISGELKAEEQDHESATFTTKINKQDGLINLEESPYKNWLKIQAYHEWPGCFFMYSKKNKEIRIKIKKASYKDGELKIISVVPENKKEMSYEDFLRGV